MTTKKILGSIRELRKSIGMNSEQLAERVGKSGGTIRHLEKAEQAGTVNLQNLRDAASALGYELEITYKKTAKAEKLLTTQAEAKADALITKLQATMALELQQLAAEDLSNVRAQLITRFLQEPKALWS